MISLINSTLTKQNTAGSNIWNVCLKNAITGNGNSSINGKQNNGTHWVPFSHSTMQIKGQRTYFERLLTQMNNLLCYLFIIFNYALNGVLSSDKTEIRKGAYILTIELWCAYIRSLLIIRPSGQLWKLFLFNRTVVCNVVVVHWNVRCTLHFGLISKVFFMLHAGISVNFSFQVLHFILHLPLFRKKDAVLPRYL